MYCQVDEVLPVLRYTTNMRIASIQQTCSPFWKHHFTLKSHVPFYRPPSYRKYILFDTSIKKKKENEANSSVFSMWKEVFCTFLPCLYIMVVWITMLPYSHQLFLFLFFQFIHSTCSEIWGLSTPNTIDQWDTTGLYSFSEQTRWIFCPVSRCRDLAGGFGFSGVLASCSAS